MNVVLLNKMIRPCDQYHRDLNFIGDTPSCSNTNTYKIYRQWALRQKRAFIYGF
jgi:hypothetical protein